MTGHSSEPTVDRRMIGGSRRPMYYLYMDNINTKGKDMNTIIQILKFQKQHDEFVKIWKAGNATPATLAAARRVDEMLVQLRASL